MKTALSVFVPVVCLLIAIPADSQVLAGTRYKALSPITQSNLTVFPVTAAKTFDTSGLLTLDEGLRSGQVVVTEQAARERENGYGERGDERGLVRPRVGPPFIQLPPIDDGMIFHGRIMPDGSRVNELSLTNRADRPLLLLAGEIVMGGKQDRVVSRDQIIPPHSGRITVKVFCVEPHRWDLSSTRFGALDFSMAQPGVRFQVMAEQNQQAVWDAVAKSRASFVTGLTAAQASLVESTSSYAGAMQNAGVKEQLNSIVLPLDQSFDKLRQQLRAEKAVGVAVALNGKLIWVDIFASPDLFDKYWPKLIRSYAAEALRPRALYPRRELPSSVEDAQAFIELFNATKQNVSTEPGLFRSTEMTGYNFYAFILTALLPNTGFNVHIAKMTRGN